MFTALCNMTDGLAQEPGSKSFLGLHVSVTWRFSRILLQIIVVLCACWYLVMQQQRMSQSCTCHSLCLQNNPIAGVRYTLMAGSFLLSLKTQHGQVCSDKHDLHAKTAVRKHSTANASTWNKNWARTYPCSAIFDSASTAKPAILCSYRNLFLCTSWLYSHRHLQLAEGDFVWHFNMRCIDVIAANLFSGICASASMSLVHMYGDQERMEVCNRLDTLQ